MLVNIPFSEEMDEQTLHLKMYKILLMEAHSQKITLK